MKVGIASFTANGEALAKRLVECMNGDTFTVFNESGRNVKSWLGEAFAECGALIFVSAAGIAVRLVSGLITSKDKDPAVIVIDEKGTFVIPILSGHLGGANALAIDIAKKLGATPVITTATDLNGVFAVDVWAKAFGCIIEDVSKVKEISSRLLAGKGVGFYTDFPIDGPLPPGLYRSSGGEAGICLSHYINKKPFDITLNVAPRVLTVGAGCRKDTNPAEFERFALAALSDGGLSAKAVCRVASIDLKAAEECLVRFSEKYGAEYVTFTCDELNAVDGAFIPSPFVMKTTGTDNVCERAAVRHTGGKLILSKTVGRGMTVAAAAPEWRCCF